MSEPLCPIHNTPMKRVYVNQPTMAYVTRPECPECEHMKRVDARWNERRFTAAVAATQGIWANYKAVAGAMPNNMIDEATVKITARLSVMQADALLEELAK